MREISLKVIFEKSNFQTVIFAIIFVTMNGHTYNHSKRYLMMLCFFFQGFGVGNFKALFEAIELEQAERGNL